MRIAKFPSLLLALALQVLPITRVFIATSPATGSSFAIVFTWIAGAVALLGSYDAVSGASTTITSPGTATATNGTPFSYRITTGPDAANTFAAAPLPSGLTVSTTAGRITGTPTVEGVFTILLTASDSGRASRTVTKNLVLTIRAGVGTTNPPSITTQPTSRTVTNGGTTTFTVVAAGTAPLAYQWRTNGVAVTGATSSTLTLSSVTTNHAGNYSVVVTNSVGSVTSSVAVLTVLLRPSITTQPTSQTVTAGNNADFNVVAAGTAPLSYQWRRSGTNLIGATSATLNLNSVTTGQAGNYSVVVANSAGSVTSTVATLTVNAAPIPPSITTQPSSRTVTNGGTTTFTVVATGTSPMAYQWLTNGVELTGATNSTLTLGSVTSDHAGNYSVVIANGMGSVTSSVAVLTVLVRPSISSQPANLNVAAGDNASFTVAADGTAPLSYQWRRNGANLTGATSATLGLPGVTVGQAGNYTVVVANSAGSVTSSVATLTVYVVTLPFTLGKTGNGTLTGPTNGQLLELGKAFVLKATPAPGNLFSNWIVSGLSVTGATLNVTMSSNLTVLANFVPTPFPGLKGSYSGLFHPVTSDPPHEQSGYFTLAVTDKGTYSGKLLLNGGTFSISGALGLDLSAQKTVLRKGTNEIYVVFQLASGLDQVAGYVSNALWVSDLFGYRAGFNAATNPTTNQLGNYTMLLSGSDAAATSPMGLGCAALAVASSGAVTLKGTLADGTAAAQKGSLAANGQLPVYVNLYRGKGSLFGWLTFTNTATNDIPGLLLWTRKDGIVGNYYPGGFTNELLALSSRYTMPAKGASVLGFSNSVALLEGGNLAGPTTNDVFLSTFNKITVTSTNTNKLALSITTSSGLLSGSFINPQTLKKSTIKGAVLQKQDLSGGFFLGTNQSGRVFLGLPQNSPIFAP